MRAAAGTEKFIGEELVQLRRVQAAFAERVLLSRVAARAQAGARRAGRSADGRRDLSPGARATGSAAGATVSENVRGPPTGAWCRRPYLRATCSFSAPDCNRIPAPSPSLIQCAASRPLPARVADISAALKGEAMMVAGWAAGIGAEPLCRSWVLSCADTRTRWRRAFGRVCIW